MRLHRLRNTLLALLLVSSSVGCSPISVEDAQRLQRLEEAYGEHASFDLEGDLYVRATLKPGAQVTLEEWERVYRHFFFETSGLQRRETSFVYLNVHAPDGSFLFQLAYDPRGARFVRNRSQHY
ncbi:MAG: hypothetical protein LC667_14530 [Thioalkalivibrio sp.]|nr:hypothetical protein [Thioalkalivibrio sp.]